MYRENTDIHIETDRQRQRQAETHAEAESVRWGEGRKLDLDF